MNAHIRITHDEGRKAPSCYHLEIVFNDDALPTFSTWHATEESARDTADRLIKYYIGLLASHDKAAVVRPARTPVLLSPADRAERMLGDLLAGCDREGRRAVLGRVLSMVEVERRETDQSEDQGVERGDRS